MKIWYQPIEFERMAESIEKCPDDCTICKNKRRCIEEWDRFAEYTRPGSFIHSEIVTNWKPTPFEPSNYYHVNLRRL